MVLFRKILSCKLALQSGGNIINLELIYDQQWCHDKVFTIEKNQNIPQNFHHMFKNDLIPLDNTLTPGLE